MKDKKPEIFYSGEVDEIISNPPGKLVRWGTAVIFLVFVVILLIAWLIKYPDVIVSPVLITESKVKIDSSSYLNGDTGSVNPVQFIGRINLGIERWADVGIGQTVNIKIRAFPYLKYGMLRGNVKAKNFSCQGDTFMVEVSLPHGLTTLYVENLEYMPNMQGTAEIITGTSSFLQRIMNPQRHFISRSKK